MLLFEASGPTEGENPRPCTAMMMTMGQGVEAHLLRAATSVSILPNTSNCFSRGRHNWGREGGMRGITKFLSREPPFCNHSAPAAGVNAEGAGALLGEVRLVVPGCMYQMSPATHVRTRPATLRLPHT